MTDKPKYSVLMTVYNRPHIVLINTLNAIGKNDWRDCEIVLVNDGSTMDYEYLLANYRNVPLRMVNVDTVKDRPGTYNLDGYNNPAYAANAGLDSCKGERIFWMSSDTILQPHTLSKAKAINTSKVAWMPCVTDLDTSQQYLGPERVCPFGWFIAVDKNRLEKVRWDEEYLKGIAFEDNDFSARLALEMGRFVIDKGVMAWHQSHPQKAYSDNLEGWRINQKYTMEKWGGVPWHVKMDPLEVEVTHVNDEMVVDVKLSDRSKYKSA